MKYYDSTHIVVMGRLCRRGKKIMRPDLRMTWAEKLVMINTTFRRPCIGAWPSYTRFMGNMSNQRFHSIVGE